VNDEHKSHGEGIDRVLHDPISDKLEPLEPLDLSQIHSVDDLVRAMAARPSPDDKWARAPRCWKPWRATHSVSS